MSSNKPQLDTSSREFRLLALCVAVLAVIALAAALSWLRPVVVPFVIAMFVAMVLGPAVDFLNVVLKIPRAISIVVVLVMAILLFIMVGGLISVSLGNLAANAGDYRRELEALLRRLIEGGHLQRFGVEPNEEANIMELLPLGTLERFVVSMTNATLRIMSQSLLVFVFVGFMFAGSRPIRRGEQNMLSKIRWGVRRYLVTKFLTSTVTGVLVFSALNILEVRHAITFGTFTFLLNFIPSIGSIAATLLPLPVVVLSPDFTYTKLVLVLAIPGAIQFAVGNVIEPKIMGDTLDLHPIVILLALIFWGMLWGFEGMLLAVPLTALIKIVLEQAEFGAPVAHLMAGRLDRAGLET